MKIYSKRKGESQFRYHRKRKYDTIFIDISWTVGEAYNERIVNEDNSE